MTIKASTKVSIQMDLSWNYIASKQMTEFLKRLQNKQIFGLRCPCCKKVVLPPRPVCGDCYIAFEDDWVDTKNIGFIKAITIVHLPIQNSRTGEPRPYPYKMALIRMSNTDTLINHFIETKKSQAPVIGDKVCPKFHPECLGELEDIIYFEVI